MITGASELRHAKKTKTEKHVKIMERSTRAKDDPWWLGVVHAWSRCVELMHMQDLMMHSHISRTE
jgi:hypothetical protein